MVEPLAALLPLIRLPGESLRFALHGQEAPYACFCAAELDPDGPWTWIVLALLTETPEGFDRLHPRAGSGGSAIPGGLPGGTRSYRILGCR